MSQEPCPFCGDTEPHERPSHVYPLRTAQRLPRQGSWLLRVTVSSEESYGVLSQDSKEWGCCVLQR